MENIIEQIFEPQFSQIHLRPVSAKYGIKKSGITYQLDNELGNGYYWIQPIRGLCTISIANLTFKHEVDFSYMHPSFLSIGNYAQHLVEHFEKNTHEVFSSKSMKSQSHVIGSICGAQRFESGFSYGDGARYVSITMMPGYYNTFLQKQFCITSSNLVDSIKDIQSSPEVEYLFSTIYRANPSRNVAELYFGRL